LCRAGLQRCAPSSGHYTLDIPSLSPYRHALFICFLELTAVCLRSTATAIIAALDILRASWSHRPAHFIRLRCTIPTTLCDPARNHRRLFSSRSPLRVYPDVQSCRGHLRWPTTTTLYPAKGQQVRRT